MERRSFVFAIALALSLLVTGPADAVVDQINKSVGVNMPPDSLDCVFFQLVGVSEPDPGVSTSAWIAIPRSHVGFKEIYALLPWAKGSGTNITIETSGQAVDYLRRSSWRLASVRRLVIEERQINRESRP